MLTSRPQFQQQNGIATPDPRGRSRPPSFGGRDSPVQLRSRSSTSDSLRSGSSPNSGKGASRSAAAALAAGSNANLQAIGKKSGAAGPGSSNVGSLKKRAAPLPPASNRPSNAHSRNASDYGVSLPAQRIKTSDSHSQTRKSLAGDSCYLNEANHAKSFHHSAAHLRKLRH